MRRASTGRDTPQAGQDASDEDAGLRRSDWTARHARTRTAPEGSSVRVEEVDDDWPRRHGRTRRA